MSQNLESESSLRWVVAIDLRAHGHGAINFASWLREHDRSGSMVIDGLHVIESVLFELPTAPPRVELLDDARKATFAALHARKAEAAFSSVDVIEASDVVDTLASAGQLPTTTGIILGRRAAEDEHAWIRLGKVARRLLRRLDTPTFVVPPNLERDAIGAGPIVCAVTLDDHGIAVGRFGERLGAALGRRVRLVHVLETADPIGVPYLSAATLDDLHRRQREAGHERLNNWHEASGLGSHTLLAQGHTLPQLLATARELDACMILCGSRRLSLVERLWSSSIGSALAAAAGLPVGVLPSGE